jgi:hypothetical protein
MLGYPVTVSGSHACLQAQGSSVQENGNLENVQERTCSCNIAESASGLICGPCATCAAATLEVSGSSSTVASFGQPEASLEDSSDSMSYSNQYLLCRDKGSFSGGDVLAGARPADFSSHANACTHSTGITDSISCSNTLDIQANTLSEL